MPTIELLCCMNPSDGSDAVAMERTEETKAMYERANQLLRPFGLELNIQEHSDDGEDFVDAYCYPECDQLEAVLKAFDENAIEYDNIDLPPNAPADLIARLQELYEGDCGTGISLNLNRE